MNTRHKGRKHGSGKRREELLQVRVTEPEKLAFGEAADLSGLGVSAWVRERLRAAAARELEAADRAIPFLKVREGCQHESPFRRRKAQSRLGTERP